MIVVGVIGGVIVGFAVVGAVLVALGIGETVTGYVHDRRFARWLRRCDELRGRSEGPYR